jgi:hypothetical protein
MQVKYHPEKNLRSMPRKKGNVQPKPEKHQTKRGREGKGELPPGTPKTQCATHG